MQRDNSKEPVIGIDLGTTFTKIAWWDGREPKVYENFRGHKATPSVIYRNPKNGEILVGEIAEERGRVDPDSGNMAAGVKRRMDKGSEALPLGDKTFTPIELSSIILKHIYDDVKRLRPGYKARSMVVTVPYHFKIHQSENTRRAAIEADINCTGIIQEPIAAGLSYAWYLAMEGTKCRETILVFDLGGGTFDLTLFRLDLSEKKLQFEVLGTAGDDHLGGMDFDQALMDLIVRKSGISFAGATKIQELKGMQKVREAAVNAKIELGVLDECPVYIGDVLPGVHVETAVSRSEYCAAIGPYLSRIEPIMADLWKITGVSPSEIDRVIMVGGSSKVVCLRDLLSRTFRNEMVWQADNIQTSIAEGAAMYAAYLDDPSAFDREIEVITRTGHALGVKTAGGGFHALIKRNRKTPCGARQQFRIVGDDVRVIPIEVYQGADAVARAEDNTLVGVIEIDDLPPHPKGLPVIVTFNVNREQLLSVSVEIDSKEKHQTFIVAGTDRVA